MKENITQDYSVKKTSFNKFKHISKPDTKHYTDVTVQIITIVIAVALFIWEIRGLDEQDKVFFWIIGIVILVSIIGILSYNYVKPKFDKIEWLESEIKKLDDQISFRKSLENINYKLGRLHEKNKKR